jgi:hypothetical protein
LRRKKACAESGSPAKQLLQRRVPAGASAGEALQGAVAIEHGALGVDDLECGLEAVGDRLDDFRLGDTLAHAQVAGQETEDEEGAGHRQQRQQAKYGKLAGARSQQRRSQVRRP